MRWNHKIGTFTVLLALGITMAGCGASSSTAGSTAASTPSTTSSEAQEAQKTEVQPMQGVLLSDPLSEGTYHISFESDKVSYSASEIWGMCFIDYTPLILHL